MQQNAKTCSTFVATVAVSPIYYSAVTLTLRFWLSVLGQSGHLNCKYTYLQELSGYLLFIVTWGQSCTRSARGHLGARFQSLTFQINHRYAMWSILLVGEVAWATSGDPVGHQFPRKKYWPCSLITRSPREIYRQAALTFGSSRRCAMPLKQVLDRIHRTLKKEHGAVNSSAVHFEWCSLGPS